MKIAALALAALSSCASADETASTDEVTVEFQGASGGLKIFPKSDANGFIMVQQSKLEEVDVNGKPGNKINVAGKNSWTPLSTTETDGKTVYSTTFKTEPKPSGDGTLELTAHLARETTTVEELVPCNNCTDTSAGQCQDASMACAAAVDGVCAEGFANCTETVTVTKDQLKFSIVVEDFPFNDENNKLEYMLTVKDKTSNSGDEAAEVDEGGDSAVKKFSLDSGFIETPTTAVIKGGEKDEVVDVDVSTTTSPNGKTTYIKFVFDSFAEGTALYYDPTLGVSTNGASSAAAVSSAAAFALLGASSVLAAF